MQNEFGFQAARKWIYRYVTSLSAASASEYAVLVALVIVVITSGVSLFDINVFGIVNQRVLTCVNGTC